MAYSPRNPNGQANAADSAPVVLARDRQVEVNQDDVVTLLGQILVGINALSATRGVAADLRTTIVGANLVNSQLGSLTQANITGLGTWVGSAFVGWSPAPSTVNWTNQTAVQSFINNIVRS